MWCHSDLGSGGSKGPRSLCSEPQPPRWRNPESPQQGQCMRANMGGHRTQRLLDPATGIIYSFGKSMALYQNEGFITRSPPFKSISVGLYWFICSWVSFFRAETCFEVSCSSWHRTGLGVSFERVRQLLQTRAGSRDISATFLCMETPPTLASLLDISAV